MINEALFENKPANYQSIEEILYTYTDGFTKEEGEYPLDTRKERDEAYYILKKYYEEVEKNTLDYSRKYEDGTVDYKVKFSKPKINESSEGIMADKDPENFNQFVDDDISNSPVFESLINESYNEAITNTVYVELKDSPGTFISKEIFDTEDPDFLFTDDDNLKALFSRSSWEYELQELLDTYADGYEISDFKVYDHFEEAIEKHDDLNRDIFGEDDKLIPEVREKLLEIAKMFTDNLKEDGIEIEPKDIVLLGSNASYNYTDASDLDTHIVADMSAYEGQEDLALKLYQAYKTIFNSKYEPLIKGHTVEIYVEPYMGE